MLALLTVGTVIAAGQPTAPQCLFEPSNNHVEYQDPMTTVGQCFRSPDGDFTVQVKNGRITVTTPHGIFPAGTMDGGRILWSPTSRGFAVADAEGSGETEVFHYVDMTSARPRVALSLRRTAVARFKLAYHCRGSRVYANTIIAGWTPDGLVRLVVQDGVHSEGCRHDEDGMIGVIGDPVTGRIWRQISAADIRRAWCTPAERADYGYCYDETAFAAHRLRQ